MRTKAGIQGRVENELGMKGPAVALGHVRAPAVLIDEHGAIVGANVRWAHLEEEGGLAGKGLGQLELVAGIGRVLSGEAPTYTVEYRNGAASGSRWFVMGVDEGGWRGAVVMHESLAANGRGRAFSLKAGSLARPVDSAIFVTDTAGKIDWVNEAFGLLSGWSDEVIGESPEVLQIEGGGTPFREVLEWCLLERRAWTGEIRNRGRAGDEYTVRQTVTPIASRTGEISHMVVIHEDIGAHRATVEQLLYMAEHDALTGLWNRKTLIEKLAEAIERNRQAASQVAVLFLDMDRFKNTNDTMGNTAGDRILVEAAQRLRASLRDADGLARFGGDEFVIILEHVADREVVATVAERVIAGLTPPFEVEGRSVTIAASVGVTLWPDDAETAEGLLRKADLAMYRAKTDGGRGHRFYDSRLEAEANERVSVEQDLNRSMESEDFWLAYQPQWDLRTGKLEGAEGLFRWEMGLARKIPIGRVIEIAEQNGMILEIGPWVMREAVRQVASWRERGFPLRVSVNLSAVQFHHQDVFGIVMDLLGAENLPPSCLRVEITESVLLDRSDRVTDTLRALHQAGVGVVLDDFGTGYSSLTYLQKFPIDMVKIDASFLRGVGERKQDEAIVRGIIQIAHSLGHLVVAEGVETEEQLDFLKAQACDLAQGYLLARPLPAVEFDKLLGLSYRGSCGVG